MPKPNGLEGRRANPTPEQPSTELANQVARLFRERSSGFGLDVEIMLDSSKESYLLNGGGIYHEQYPITITMHLASRTSGKVVLIEVECKPELDRQHRTQFALHIQVEGPWWTKPIKEFVIQMIDWAIAGLANTTVTRAFGTSASVSRKLSLKDKLWRIYG